MTHGPERRPDPRLGVIVVCGMPFGGSPPFADTHLARALGALHPVLVVDQPTAVHRAPRRLRPRLRPLPGVAGSWLLEPVALPANERPPTAWASDAWLSLQIERSARRVLPQARAMVTLSPARGLLRGVQRDRTVYWRRDLAAHYRYAASVRHIRARSDSLLRRANLVTAVSPHLVAESRVANPAAVLLPNGSDVAHFGARRLARPANFPVAADRPVLGYVGAVSWRIDHELLAAVAASRPDWAIVLVGPVDGPIAQAPNIYPVGLVCYEELPAWTQAFDVGIVPYRLEEFNRASFPLKVFDYLASGVPVATTDLPALRGLGQPVRSATDAAGFVGAVDELLAHPPGRAACRELAAANSWDERARRLVGLLHNLDEMPLSVAS